MEGTTLSTRWRRCLVRRLYGMGMSRSYRSVCLSSLIRYLTLATKADLPKLRPSSSSSKFKSLFKSASRIEEPQITLAKYRTPNGITKGDLRIDIFREGVPHVFHLLLSTILLNAKRSEWKAVQSKSSPEDLEATFTSDVSGS
jgi:hypothetical protein